MTTTLGKLLEWAPPPEEEAYFDNLIEALDELYPSDWRDWTINETTFKDLFGESLLPEVEGRLRFALPTVRLAKIFGCETSLSERRYRSIKRTLIEWPIGRALIYQPCHLMTKVHPTGAYNKFYETIQTLKHGFLSRHQASDVLKGDTTQTNATPRRSSSSASKRSHSPENPTNGVKVPKNCDTSLQETLSHFMRQQNEMLAKLCDMTHSTFQQSNARPPQHTYADPTEDSQSTNSNKDEDPWKAPPLGEGSEPLDLTEEEEEDEPLLDFAPDTKEAEAKISKAEDKIAQQGIHCQRLGGEGWKNIRYSDVQKQFQATPVFTSLKVNGNLATMTPSWQLVSVLEKMDLCLGAISHGLLQQRKSFEDIYAKAAPAVKTHISKNFLGSDSVFRKTSDSLLQYTCGKRAEVLEQRRAIYKPPNKTISEILHGIPPSSTHLFAEPQLSDFVKEQGGITKIFPGKFRKPATTLKSKAADREHRATENKEKPQPYDFRKNKGQERKPAKPAGKRATTRQKKSRYEGKRY